MLKIAPSSLGSASVEEQSACFIPHLTAVLNKHGVPFSFSEGTVPYVTHDKYAVEVFVNSASYPSGLAAKLYDKKELQDVLKQYGFNTLDTEIVTDPDSVTLTNFIVKLREGSGGNLPKSNTKNWFNGFLFSDKEAFKCHPLFDTAYKSEFYVAQQGINPRAHVAVSLFCSVNTVGDVFFIKNSTDTWANTVRTEAVLESNGYEEIKSLLAAFVKTVGIKHTVFSLQFISDGVKLYPMDWNFRWGKNFHKQILNHAPELYELGIMHMFKNTPTEYQSADKWVANREDIAALWV